MAVILLPSLIWFYMYTDARFFSIWLTINFLLNVMGPIIYVS